MTEKLTHEEQIRRLANSDNPLDRIKSRIMSRIDAIENAPGDRMDYEIHRIGGMKAAIEEINHELLLEALDESDTDDFNERRFRSTVARMHEAWAEEEATQ